MELYRPVNLECAEMLKILTSRYMLSFNFACVKYMTLSEPNLNIVNSEFNSKGISNIFQPLIFKKSIVEVGPQHCHIDHYEGQRYHASIVIPVIGCRNTYQYWYDGEYDATVEFDEITKVTFLSTAWKRAELIDKAYIFGSPMLCRTDIPHGAVSNGREYRVTCTIRFEGNETYEELCEKLGR